MKIASVAEVKSQFSAFLKATAAGPVVVTKNGRPVAVIVGVQDDDEVEQLLMAHSPRLQAIVEASRKQIRDGDVLTHDQKRAPSGRARIRHRLRPLDDDLLAVRAHGVAHALEQRVVTAADDLHRQDDGMTG